MILSRNIAGNIDTCLNSHSIFVLTGSALHNNVYVFTLLCTVRL